jgi:hypothetical protein
MAGVTATAGIEKEGEHRGTIDRGGERRDVLV